MSVAVEQLSSAVGEHHERTVATRGGNRLHQALPPQVMQLATVGIERSAVRVPHVARGDDAEGADGSKCPRLRAPQQVRLSERVDVLARPPTRQVHVVHEHVPRVARVGRLALRSAAAATSARHLAPDLRTAAIAMASTTADIVRPPRIESAHTHLRLNEAFERGELGRLDWGRGRPGSRVRDRQGTRGAVARIPVEVSDTDRLTAREGSGDQPARGPRRADSARWGASHGAGGQRSARAIAARSGHRNRGS